MPADLAGVATLVLGTSDALGRQNKQLLDELARELAQQVIDGQLGLSNHGQQRQGRFGVGGEQGLFAQLVDIEFTGDMEFGFRLCHGG